MGDKLGSKVNKLRRSIKDPIEKKIGQTIEKPFRKGATAAKRTAADQIAKQQQMESVRLAEAEGEVAKRKGSAFGKSAGRKSLIKSSAGGLATNLGGTA